MNCNIVSIPLLIRWHYSNWLMRFWETSCIYLILIFKNVQKIMWFQGFGYFCVSTMCDHIHITVEQWIILVVSSVMDIWLRASCMSNCILSSITSDASFIALHQCEYTFRVHQYWCLEDMIYWKYTTVYTEVNGQAWPCISAGCCQDCIHNICMLGYSYAFTSHSKLTKMPFGSFHE